MQRRFHNTIFIKNKNMNVNDKIVFNCLIDKQQIFVVNWKKFLRLFLLILIQCSFTNVRGQNNADQLKVGQGHPVLYFNSSQIEELKRKADDPFFDSAIVRPMLKEALYKNINVDYPEKGMLATCLAFMLTGESIYLENAIYKLQQIIEIPGNWTQPPYKYPELKYMNITAARRAYAIGITYDILHEFISEDIKEEIKLTLKEKVFSYYLKAFERYDSTAKCFVDENGHNEWWNRCYFAWNPKVNGMIGVAALATLNEISESEKVLELARYSIKQSFYNFEGENADGSFKDGPQYLIYYLANALRFYVALENKLNTDDGFFKLPGINKSLEFIADFMTPDSSIVPYGYTPYSKSQGLHDELYFLLRDSYENSNLDFYDSFILHGGNMPFALLWRPHNYKLQKKVKREQIKLYKKIDWAFIDAQKMYITIRGGDNASRKNHPEAGELLIWLKEQIILSPGNYLDKNPNSKNTLIFNGEGQIDVSEKLLLSTDRSKYYAKVLICEEIDENYYIKINLAKCYNNVNQYQRHLLVTKSGSLIVIDNAIVDKHLPISQNWTTPLEVMDSKDGFLLMAEKRGMDLYSTSNVPLKKEVESEGENSIIKISTKNKESEIKLINVFTPARHKNPDVTVVYTEGGITISVELRKKIYDYYFKYSDAGLTYSKSER